PLVEKTALFRRGIGEATDIVEKEMYTWDDRADKSGEQEQLSLRPENTAGVVRAVVEHNLLYDGGKRLWYTGPMFRRERPQKGRYRQFHQVGVEALCFAGPEVDAEVIALAARLLRELGVTEVQLQINSIGQPDERARHREDLIAHLERHRDALDDDALRRMHSNPLRTLDTKNPALQAMAESAPRMLDYLGAESRAHFEALQGMLRALGIDFVINPRLVRGLDYYNRTVFEFVTTALGAQGTVCGGGRYDYLIEQIGGKPAPAVGWGMGMERVIELMQSSAQVQPSDMADVYVVVQHESLIQHAVTTSEALRTSGMRVILNGGQGSLKSQMKRADASGARVALIFGEAEW
ncbi:MAG: histidine--tRNA ligase, partial [Betaproteobacteria bacterium]|nr:histidine--tRNA ligase [Betaproteobacteria bacterium]